MEEENYEENQENEEEIDTSSTACPYKKAVGFFQNMFGSKKENEIPKIETEDTEKNISLSNEEKKCPFGFTSKKEEKPKCPFGFTSNKPKKNKKKNQNVLLVLHQVNLNNLQVHQLMMAKKIKIKMMT